MRHAYVGGVFSVHLPPHEEISHHTAFPFALLNTTGTAAFPLITWDKVNVHGRASGLGHPLGATGARLLRTLLHRLNNRHLMRGIACLCPGGGEVGGLVVGIDHEASILQTM